MACLGARRYAMACEGMQWHAQVAEGSPLIPAHACSYLVHLCASMRIYVHQCASLYVHVYACMCMYVYVCAYMYVYVHICAYMCVCSQVMPCIYTYIPILDHPGISWWLLLVWQLRQETSQLL